MVNILVNGSEILLISATNTLQQIKNEIQKQKHLRENDYYLLQNGKKIDENSRILGNLDVHLILRLNGGKGGFGSMLKAIGAQIEKTTNREACRDLSGRRLRDINEEKRLKAYLEKLKEQPEDAEAQKIQKKIDKLLSKPKHEFKDAKYEKERSDLTEKIDEAVEQGFRKAFEAASTELPKEGESSSKGLKRKSETDTKAKKKKKGTLWLGADDLSSSSDTSESESSKSNDESK